MNVFVQKFPGGKFIFWSSIP